MAYYDLYALPSFKNLHAPLKGGGTLEWWWAKQNQDITHKK